MSQLDTAISPLKHPTTERVCLPLRKAIELLTAKLLDEEGVGQGREVLDNAVVALAYLDGLMPSAQFVLEEFLGTFGPVEAKFSRIQNEAWRNSEHEPKLTENMCDEVLLEIEGLFYSLAATPQRAETAFACVKAQTSLLKDALDAAQADGWKHGDYITEEREALVDKFIGIVTATATELLAD